MADAENGGSTKGWLDKIYKIFAGEPQNQKQLLDLLKNLQSHQLFGVDELGMIEGVLQVSDMQVRDIMVPRGQMVVLDHEDSLAEVITKITECGHSRFPVIDDDKDDVVGILLAKDLLHLSLDDGDVFENSPNLNTEVLNRMVFDNKVIDHEIVTNRKEIKHMELIAIYEIEEGLIRKAHFVRAKE